MDLYHFQSTSLAQVTVVRSIEEKKSDGQTPSGRFVSPPGGRRCVASPEAVAGVAGGRITWAAAATPGATRKVAHAGAVVGRHLRRA
jgi:hypothetical protein